MRYTARKILTLLITMAVVSFLTFAAFDLISGDPAATLLGTQAITQLQTVTALEANILAYNDTYLLTASIATATLVWILWRLLRLRITARMALKNATGNK